LIRRTVKWPNSHNAGALTDEVPGTEGDTVRVFDAVVNWGPLVLALCSAGAAEEDARLPAARTWTIRAHTESGEPAAGASLRIEALSALPRPDERTLEQKINERLSGTPWHAPSARVPESFDERGEAALEVLGNWLLRVHVATPTESASVLVACGPTHGDGVDVTLKKDAVIALALAIEGIEQSLPRCVVRVDGDARPREAFADDDGVIRVRGLAAGARVRLALPTRLAFSQRSSSCFKLEPETAVAGELGTQTVVNASIVQAPLQTITGRIVDAFGQPIEGRVEWIDASDDTGVDVMRTEFTNGNAFAIDVIPGAILRIRADGFVDELALTAPFPSELGEIALRLRSIVDRKARGRVRGTVTWHDTGAPISNATVRLTQMATGEVREFAHTDGSGRFDLDPVPVGDLKVEASVGIGYAVQRVHLAEHGTIDVALQVAELEAIEVIAVDAETSVPIARAYAVVDGIATPQRVFAMSAATATPFEFRAPGYRSTEASLRATDAVDHRIVVPLQRRSP
jgi:hypothetical protein